jgi:hypothetical protein
MRQFYLSLSAIALCLLSVGETKAQIFGPEGVNIPGDWNTFSTPGSQPFGGIQATAGSPDRRFLLQSTLPTKRYSTTVNVQASGGDVSAGTKSFLFASGPGPGGAYYNNKWGSVTVTPNSVQTYSLGGANNSATIANGVYYTINFKDNGYANTSAIFLTTTSAPVTIPTVSVAAASPYVSASQLDGVATTVTATISASLSSDQRVYLHYSDNANYTGSAVTNGDIVPLTGSGTTYSADIPAAFNTLGKTVYYYVFTTNTSATPAYGTTDVSLRAIRFNNNNTLGGYTYTVGGHATAPGATVWSNAASWASGQVPPAQKAVTLNHSITNDVVSNIVGSMTLASGVTLTLNEDLSTTSGTSVTVPVGATVTITSTKRFATGVGGDLTNNGTISNSSGRITAGRSLINSGTITIGNSGTLFLGQQSTATALTNNGTLTFSTGATAFITGAVTVGGTTNTTFASVSLNTPGAGTSSIDFGTASTVSNTLTINPSTFVSPNAPIYGSSATLLYAGVGSSGTPYGRGIEWSSTTAGAKGYPNNVSLSGSWLNLSSGAPGTLRQIAGDLTLYGGTGGLLMDFGSDDMTQPLVVKGAVSIGAGTTVSLSDVSGGDIKVEGASFTNSGTFSTKARALFTNGSGTQTISGTGGLNVDYLVVNCPTLQLASDVNVAAVSGGNGVLMNGDINLRGWKLQIRSGANLQVASALRTILSSGGSGPDAQLILRRNNTITQTGGGTLNIASAVKVITGEYGLVTSGPVNFGGITTINGTLEIQTGGYVDGSGGNGPLYGTNSQVIYNTGLTYDRRSEWDGQNSARTPFNVTVTGNTTLNAYDPGVSVGDINLPGTLTIAAGSTFDAGSQPNDFVINGTLTNAGTLTLSSTVGGDTKLGDDFINTGTFNANGRAVWFIGGNQQDISSTSALSLSYVVMNKTAGKVNLLSNISIPAPNGGTAIVWMNSTSTFDLNGRALTVGTPGVGAIIGTPPAGSGFSGTASATISLLGTGNAGTLAFVTGGQQLGTLLIDRTSGGFVTLGSPLTLHNSLTLTNGRVQLASNDLTLTAAAAIAGASASNYVETNSTGALAREGMGTTGITSAVLFPVGSATAYNPATLTNSGTLDTYRIRVANVSAFTPPYPTRQINRFWTVSEGVVGGSNATLKLQWQTAEEGASFIRTGTIVLVKNDGIGFSTVPASLISGTNPFTAEATGITSFSEWSVGNDNVLPVELLFFSGRMSGPDALLAWQTASERDNQLFDVERSLDGRSFERIGTLAGAGTSSVPHAYRFTDRGAALLGASVLYYRLRQLDYSGQTSFSTIVTLSPGSTDGTAPVIFPNVLTSDDFTLECFTKTASSVTLSLTDAIGQMVYKGAVALESGYTDVSSRALPNFAGLAPGVYHARVQLSGQPEVRLKVVRQ